MTSFSTLSVLQPGLLRARSSMIVLFKSILLIDLVCDWFTGA